MNIRNVSKMIAAAGAGAVSAPGVMLVTIPPEVPVPWWGYILAAVVNAAWLALVVYRAPANTPA